MRHRAPHPPHTHRRLVPLTGLALVLAVGVLGACGDDDEPSDTTAVTTTTPSDTTQAPDTTEGLANPASEFCVASGGQLEIVVEATGEIAYCNLPDGTHVEEWEYFRSMSSTTTTG